MNWNYKAKKHLQKAFAKTRYTLDFGDGYLNISRPDGIHCEFYPAGNDECSDELYLLAQYTVRGKLKDIQCLVPFGLEDFVSDVKDILGKGVK